jgi:hypothetical protein
LTWRNSIHCATPLTQIRAVQQRCRSVAAGVAQTLRAFTRTPSFTDEGG